MVCLAGSVVAIAATAGAAAPAVAAGAQFGLATGGAGALGSAAGMSTAAAVGTSAAVGGTGGAIAGASAVAGAGAATVTGAGIGAAAGAGSAASLTSVAAGVMTGPIGWAVLGTSPSAVTENDQELRSFTFDCWKPVVHDDSREPSNGRLLRDIFTDPRVIRVETVYDDQDGISHLVLENQWGEKFQIDFFQLMSTTLGSQIAAHATLIR